MPEQTEHNLIDFIRILLRWKFFIGGLVALTIAASVIVSLLLPTWYRAEALLLVPEKPFGFGFSANMEGLGGFSLPGLSLTGMDQETRRIITILTSRTMMEQVIDQFHLQALYEKKTQDETIKALRENLYVDIEDEGAVIVAALDQSPEQAAEMVSFMISELERRNVELNTTSARLTREFIEKQYDKNKRLLEKTEDRYRAFTQEHHVIALPEQIKSSIDAVVALQADVVKQEIQVNVMERMLGAEHADVRQSRAKLEEQRERLNHMIFQGEQVIGNAGRGEDTRLFVPFQDIPEVGLEIMRLERDMKIQNEIHGMLTQFFEQAKIQEAKDTPAIQILDRPVPPERKYKPQRSLIVLAFTAASLFVALGLVFTVEYLRRIKSVL